MKCNVFVLFSVLIIFLTSTANSKGIETYLSQLKNIGLQVKVVSVKYTKSDKSVELTIDCTEYATLVLFVEGYPLQNIPYKYLLMYTIYYSSISFSTEEILTSIVFDSIGAKVLKIRNVEIKEVYDNYGYAKQDTLFISSIKMYKKDFKRFNKKYLQDIAAASRRLDSKYIDRFKSFLKKVHIRYSQKVKKLLAQ